MRKSPVIINQVSAKLGAAIAAHASAPVVIDQIRPERPWELPEGGEILVTSSSAWRNAPAGFRPPSSLKWVQTETAGVDIYPEALKRDCVMTCGRGLTAVPIAEFVFAAMLRHEKKLEETRARAKADWTRPPIGTLYGRKLGLIGFGALGQAIVHRALAFGMDILVNRRGAWAEVPHGVTPCASAAEVFARADHLVIAAPLTSETQGMVDAELLSQAKAGLHLINISRGALVDQVALLDALNAGKVGYATLDVTTPEPLPDGHPLYLHDKVFISPHISWMGGENSGLFRERFLKNLDAYLSGRPLDYLVDPERGY
ncbi:NAD(P)-dependent oxidoreductase [Neorhizobium alkalisoli]|uniref:Phosphoglycerate dehydrogenase-like enzyme n=1 Tax=Neorhizobium alkalisoli TaxID=528178 RepID=A0A561R8J0_9HYPH|nr:NAD(P)-dependent oxidoreductase [Neorhizobium alkalisoli]TWF58929.1 phosphoglycerate dehydrogenase-like enzyme [Neorhizobium alkalisoli]